MIKERSITSKHFTAKVQHLFFPDEDNFTRFCRKLRKCKSTFLGCIYQLTHQTIIDILISLATQGCRVDIIMDQNSEEQEERKKITINKLLVMSGFKVNVSLIESKGLMHTKYCVIDNKITILGSANWTFQAFSNNFEHITIIKDSKTAKQFTEQFKFIWDQAKQAKFIESQVEYLPNQNYVEFESKKRISPRLRIQKRQFKMKFRKYKPKYQQKQKKKQQKKKKQIPQFQQAQVDQKQHQVEIEQIEEQQKRYTFNQLEIKEFFENLKLNEEKKQPNNEKNNTIKKSKINFITQDINPWQIQQQLVNPNIIQNSIKRIEPQNKDRNIIIIDEEDDEDVQIITDFSKNSH
ncbi:unnamed protein product (macronuclear) [Paramecium tetraurelia]|uniref:Mitochondrial cardiolipin hydrolase n=1 Tax=Paramecium tetraurelia TaxID=5888 RepID=A0BT79_PARTE|nr:uncharacterized protein GSPATT00031978001 [Paramecium tetraurelia]CAK61746.1 unnamed protein product [Paramecium tetraurelia]|eukprot:XP_001429144.1 hypothetical protein (macronuclear) [Paramecium tetraurelia strain d4-2]